MGEHNNPVAGMPFRHLVCPSYRFVPRFEFKGNHQKVHPACLEKKVIVLSFPGLPKVPLSLRSEVRVIQRVLRET